MPVVEFHPAGIKVEVPEGTELMDAAAAAGVSINAPCGGKGTCGKCAVRIISGTPVVRHDGAKKEDIRDGEILACRASVGTDDLTIDVPERRLAADDRPDEQKVSSALTAVIQSPSRKTLSEIITLTLPEPGMDDGIADLERVTRELRKNISGLTGDADVMPDTMRKLPDAIREDDMNITAAYCNGENRIYIAEVIPGKKAAHYGLAIDMGTTSVSVRCVDLATGTVLRTMSGYNAQIACGLDVISRIQYSKSRERLDDLRSRAVETIRRLTFEITESLGISHDDIYSAVVSGNTVMAHLLLGITAEYLRLAPYTPAIMKIPPMRAQDVGIAMNPGGMVYFSPAVGSYVGGDITAGVLAAGIDRSSEVNMFIDIGTNGELVIGNSDFLLACACSAGPAFEGGGISCGMRATRGAVNGVSVDPATGAASVTVIDGVKPEGICGSGVIDLMAELFLKGFLDPSGKFRDDKGSPAISREGRRGLYELAGPGTSAFGSSLFITETDVDNVMRAKAAIYSASQLLLGHGGMDFPDLGAVYVAGGFGQYLNLNNAIAIGLLPDLPAEKFVYIGNASLEGSTMSLLSKEEWERQQKVADSMTYINLSDEPGYMDRYTAALFIPHTDFSRFPSVMKRMENK
jgi:uncharacterized 2Fe-2S/4Fe-4S cluster protein (DUF4445 family)